MTTRKKKRTRASVFKGLTKEELLELRKETDEEIRKV